MEWVAGTPSKTFTETKKKIMVCSTEGCTNYHEVSVAEERTLCQIEGMYGQKSKYVCPDCLEDKGLVNRYRDDTSTTN